MKRICKKHRLSRRAGEIGQAAAEMALILPVTLLVVFGILITAGWYFQQTVVAIAASDAAWAGGISRGNIGLAQQRNQAILDAFGVDGTQTEVSVDTGRRAVIVRTTGEFEWKLPIFNFALRLFGGSFGRRQDFYGGPPNPWE
jgi:Flp pilus assembly protein TadG